jgi:membrane-bound lytic murein transglycosylase A
MNRILCPLLLLPVLLAACSSVPPETAAPGTSPGPAPSSLAQRPLVIPPPGTFHDTRPRALAGRFRKASWAELPGWSSDGLDHAWKAFINNCKGLMRPVSGSLNMPARATPSAWRTVCAEAASSGISLAAPDAAAVRAFLQRTLQPWRVLDAGGAPAGNLVTGYYEPLVHASRTRGGDYQWPLYAPPDDLLTIDLGSEYPALAGKRVRGKLVGKRVVPYDTRAQIAADPDKPPVIVWVNDPVDAFFLQVQGSGRAQLPDGTVVRLAYADHNGRPYVSIGHWLADQGQMPLSQASMQNIKAWARSHPGRVQEMLNANPAVVFFKEEAIVDPDLGPAGAYGVPLIGGRSIAVDASFVPLGTPVFLATDYPGTGKPLDRLVFAQDTGAAIRGAGRADFYWGFGSHAGELAGRMKQRGQMWVLWPKQAGAPSAR